MRVRTSAAGKWALVDQAASDPKRGAELTQALAEVTATPEYVWRK